jgi:NAD(P)-dependent dehydrogenase (short-subunit alcohol dehydrogenase family)
MANLTPNTHPVARTVVVTGTSSAIGLATAVELAKAGWNTVATRRNLERASALNDAAADAVRIRSCGLSQIYQERENPSRVRTTAPD